MARTVGVVNGKVHCQRRTLETRVPQMVDPVVVAIGPGRQLGMLRAALRRGVVAYERGASG